MNKFAAMSAVTLLLSAAAAQATPTIITQWNFDLPTGVNNNPAPSIGTGFATPVGMNNDANNADILNNPGSSDPGPNGRAWRVRGSVNNGWSGTTQLLSGAQFSASTETFENIVVSFDLFATDGSPRHGQFQYTLNGTDFVSFGPILDFNPGDAWFSFTYDLSAIAGVADNPNFGFKVVSAFSPVEFTNNNGLQPANTAFQRANAGLQVYTGASGNWRFDMVTFSGTLIPTPSAVALLGLGGLLASRRRR
jgi:hypothetical protein